MDRRGNSALTARGRSRFSQRLTVSDICRKRGIAEPTYYRWRQKHAPDQVDADCRHHELEVDRLKKLEHPLFAVGPISGPSRRPSPRLDLVSIAVARYRVLATLPRQNSIRSNTFGATSPAPTWPSLSAKASTPFARRQEKPHAEFDIVPVWEKRFSNTVAFSEANLVTTFCKTQ